MIEENPTQTEQAQGNATEQNTPEHTTSQRSAGQILANARKALGISLEDLAEQIRVPKNVLVSIEADEMPSNLPETFVRGYIRSYAKKVDVEESLVLTQVDSTAASAPDAMQMHSFSKRSKRKKVERRLTMISWLIVSVLAVAVVIWWYQTTGSEMLQSSDVTDEASSNLINPVENQSIPVPFASQSEGKKSVSGNGEEPADMDNFSAPISETDNFRDSALTVQSSEGDSDSAANKSQAALSQQNEQPVVSTEQSTSQAVTQQSTTPQESQPTAPQSTPTQKQQDQQGEQEQSPVVLSDAQKRLLAENGETDEEDFIKAEFKFEQEVWVEVYDAFDERIAIGNKPAGYLMTLNAQAPFRVLLGSTFGVTIWVNGEEYDISHIPTNRVARFEIEAQP